MEALSGYSNIEPQYQFKIDETLAITFQSLVRRALAYDKYENIKQHRLNPCLVNRLLPYLTDENLNQLPIPLNGVKRRHIRILEKEKVVIRQAPDENYKKNLLLRLEKMQWGREIIKKNQYEHIKIPKATLVERKLIEKLLPHIKGGRVATMAYYVENYQLFNKAIEEFTKFLMQTTLKDILGNYNNYLDGVWPYGFPRYDNVLLGEEIKNGQKKYVIGLPDLETFKPEPKINCVEKAARKAILLFPYNYDLIMDTCKKCVTFTKFQEEGLIDARRVALKGLNETIGTHDSFLANCTISSAHPLLEIQNSPERMEELIEELSARVLKRYKKSRGTSFLIESYKINLMNLELIHKKKSAIVFLKLLGEYPEEMINYCKKVVFKKHFDFFQEIQETYTDLQNKPSSTKYEMLATRELFCRKAKRCENFKIPSNESEQNSYAFTAKLLERKNNTNIQNKTVHPSIADLIIKSELSCGDTGYEIAIMILELFKENGLIANYFDQDHYTVVLI